MANAALRALEALKGCYGAGCAAQKIVLLRRLARTSLARASEVARLHEVLCFLRAYADDARLLAAVQRLLERFARRADLRRFAEELENSGIAGTAIRFPFFHPTARWLATRWPDRLAFDRLDRAADRAIGAALCLTGRWPSGYTALDRMRPRGLADAVYFLRLVDAMPGDTEAHERYYDAIEPVLELTPGAGTPNRTLAGHRAGRMHWQRAALTRTRPELKREFARAPRAVRSVPAAAGERLIELARAAMVTRSRDLDAFAYGDAHSVRLIEDAAGLAFALNGVVPERQPKDKAIYGGLMLRNGAPIGYLQLDIAGPLAEVSYNVFATFRGGDAAQIFARVLAMTHHLFGSTSFRIEPFQLGKGNDEGIASGAWWFYMRFGFRPRASAGKRLARREQARLRAEPAYRSDAATLRRLAEFPLYYAKPPQ